MLTVTIDILNEKALSILRSLEQLKIIHLRKEGLEQKTKIDWNNYKGAMSKQSIESVNQQLDELRNQ